MKRWEVGKLSSGEVVEAVQLSSGKLTLQCLNYGAVIQHLWVESRCGAVDIVLGFDTVSEYERNPNYIGVVVGQVAGRIHQGRFQLNGSEYQLACNEAGKTHLHGGIKGLSHQLFQIECVTENSVTFFYAGEGMQEGYPGQVNYWITYSLTEQGVTLDYKAIPTVETPISLTQHTYFNLNGSKSEIGILNHTLQIESNKVLELGSSNTPTGEFIDVKDTFFDFNQPKELQQHFDNFQAFTMPSAGIDHAFVLPPQATMQLFSPATQLMLKCKTSEPVVVCYSGNMLKTEQGKGRKYESYDGICLETQQYPDAVNHPHFPSTCFTFEHPYVQKTTWEIIEW